MKVPKLTMAAIRQLYFVLSPVPVILIVVAQYCSWSHPEMRYPQMPGMTFLIYGLYTSLSLCPVGFVLVIASKLSHLKLLPIISATALASLPFIFFLTLRLLGY